MLEDLLGLYEVVGLKGTIILGFLFFFIPGLIKAGINAYSLHKHAQSNRILGENVNLAFPMLAKHFKEGTHIDLYNSLLLYDEFYEAHVHRKSKYIYGILRNNNLKSRRDEIKDNIKTEFSALTEDSISKLSRFKSMIGDIGLIVKKNIDWEELFLETFEVVFNEEFTKEQKINDFELKMKKYAVKIREVLKARGEENK